MVVTEGGETRKEHVLQLDGARLDSRKHIFTVRTAKKWNELPEKVKKTDVNELI